MVAEIRKEFNLVVGKLIKIAKLKNVCQTHVTD